MENEAALSVTLYVTAGRTEIETWIYLRAQDGTASCKLLINTPVADHCEIKTCYDTH